VLDVLGCYNLSFLYAGISHLICCACLPFSHSIYIVCSTHIVNKVIYRMFGFANGFDKIIVKTIVIL